MTISIKSKLSRSRSRSRNRNRNDRVAAATPTPSAACVACIDPSDAEIDTEEANAIGTFLSNASSIVANAFSEAKSMAEDMHAIITTHVDEEYTVKAQSNQDDIEKKSAVQPAKSTSKEKGSHPSISTVTVPMKERTVTFLTRANSMRTKERKICESREDDNETEAEEVKPTSSSSGMDVKGNPATLAMLMMKLDMKQKQVEKLKRQLAKTEQEEVETKKSIRALASKYRGVLNVVDDDRNEIAEPVQTSFAHNSRNSSCSNTSVATATATEFDDDDELTDDSEWEDEERDDAAMDLALWYKATACIDPDIPSDD